MIKLNETRSNQEYRVKGVNAPYELKYRFYDLGIVEGSRIKRLKSSPLGDPVSYFVKGTVLAIRNSDALHIEVEEI